MGNLGGKTGPTLDERITNAKATGRIKLLPGDDAEKVSLLPELKNVKAIDLSACKLKRLPSGVGTNLLKIQVLKLSDNPELEELPTELAALKELRKLDCSNCSRLQSLAVLPKGVEELLLSGCNFEGYVEHPLLPLSNRLTKLDLSHNVKILGFGPAFGFEILENLDELDMSFTSLDTIPEDIGWLKNLTVLKLESTKVKTLPLSLFERTKLSRLELKGTPMTKAQLLDLPGVESFMKRRKEQLDKEIAGGVLSVDRSVCGLD